MVAAFLPLLRAGRGRVINISAQTARVPAPFLAPLVGSKAALYGSMSDALRLELPRGPSRSASSSGATQTEIFAKAAAAATISLKSADPGRVALYERQLAAVAKASARQRTAPVDPVAKAIAAAVRAARPRRHYTVGAEARLAGVLAGLPVGVKERLIARLLGLEPARVRSRKVRSWAAAKRPARAWRPARAAGRGRGRPRSGRCSRGSAR